MNHVTGSSSHRAMALAEDREGIVVAWLRDHVLFLLQNKLCVCVFVSLYVFPWND